MKFVAITGNQCHSFVAVIVAVGMAVAVIVAVGMAVTFYQQTTYATEEHSSSLDHHRALWA